MSDELFVRALLTEENLDKLSEYLERFAQPSKKHEARDWAGIIFGYAYAARDVDTPWRRKAGSVSAGKQLTKIVDLLAELKRRIESLPLEAMDALDAVGEANDQRSSAIAKMEIKLTDSEEDELNSRLFSYVLLEDPICPVDKARTSEWAVRAVRRVTSVRKLSETVLPQLIWAAGEAKQQLSNNTTHAGRPPLKYKEAVTKIAAQAYKALSGLPANRTANNRGVPPFENFVDGLYPLLGVHSDDSRGKGGISQTKKLRKGRAKSKKDL